MKRKLVFINSHPIQYFAPLYQHIAKDGTFDLEVWYCSRHGLDGQIDKQFGRAITWDIPLLEGYSYRFLKSSVRNPSIYSFWGLVNWQIVTLLWKLPQKSIVIVHGWAYFSNWISMFFGRLLGHQVCIRGEAPLIMENNRTGIKNYLRHFFLRSILLKISNYFLYIGKQNLLFYQYFGIDLSKLIFTPYSVDNKRFQQDSILYKEKNKSLRQELGLPENVFIFLSSGKLITKKRPFDLLKALTKTQNGNIFLLFVGDGELRADMEKFILDNDLKNKVSLVGFVNQGDIAKYYAVSNVYVMCSEYGETWGLSTNEAMNFSLPIILSDQVGCKSDLLKEGENGYGFRCGDIDELAQKMDLLANASKQEVVKMGDCSLRLVSEYSYDTIILNLQKI